jgi:hypothetical protein
MTILTYVAVDTIVAVWSDQRRVPRFSLVGGLSPRSLTKVAGKKTRG